MLDSLFNKVAGLQPWNFIKKRLQYRYFPKNIAKFLWTPVFIEHLLWLLVSLAYFTQCPMNIISVFVWQNGTNIFSVSLQFEACCITGQWGEFRVKNATICLDILFWYSFVVYHHKICVFIIFISSFDKVQTLATKY